LQPPLESLRSALSLPPGGKRLSAVRRFALELLGRHVLPGWSFGFNRRKRSLGLCFHHRKAVELSVHLVERNGPEEVLDTLLHEIAHALVGPGHGHDAVWRRKCVEVGARPKRCGDADMPEGPWRAQCPRCGKRYDRHRKPKRLKSWFCPSCGPVLGGLAWNVA
jgi:predicted SprT family Zn-dependent metalloprotease